MRIIYIHGATASERSFAFIQKSIKSKNPIYLNYEKEGRAFDNLKEMINILDFEDGPFFVVAHSLGGIYAVYLQQEFGAIQGAVSLATPFNGSEIAVWGAMLNPSYRLFRDITPNSNFISNSRDIPINIPWTQVVTTVGNVPWIAGNNDGVVTTSSMTCREDVDYTEVDRNHYEIVLSKRVVDIIQERVYK